MRKVRKVVETNGDLYLGIDLHKRSWHVTVRTEATEILSTGIPGKWEALQSLLNRYRNTNIHAVYEAGYFGFWLYDYLIEYGVDCLVTPPGLIPQEYRNRVKTDRRDSRKLAYFLAKGMLKRAWVPSEEERYHRQVVRRRRQLVRDRVRTQTRIKAELRFYGLDIPEPAGKWTKVYITNLRRIRFKNRWMQESFNRLLEQYQFFSDQVDKQTGVLRELSETELYSERVKLLASIPGIGMIASMEILVELQDVSRFRRADQLAAYIGLTPAQFSSADKVRMGRITRIGNKGVRTVLVEAAWKLIGKDMAMRKKYEKIKVRSGGKRAIIAIARKLLLCIRRMLLDSQIYSYGLSA